MEPGVQISKTTPPSTQASPLSQSTGVRGHVIHLLLRRPTPPAEAEAGRSACSAPWREAFDEALGRGRNVLSGTFPGSPKSISEQFVISPTCQGFVFLEETAKRCPARAASWCKAGPTSGGVCTGTKGDPSS